MKVPRENRALVANERRDWSAVCGACGSLPDEPHASACPHWSASDEALVDEVKGEEL